MIFHHQGLRNMIDLNFLMFQQGPRDMKNHKFQVNKRYHVFYSPPLFCTAGSGGALCVQRDSSDFRANTHFQLVGSDEFVPQSIVPTVKAQSSKLEAQSSNISFH